MKRLVLIYYLTLIFLVVSCSKTEKIYLLPERQEIANALIDKALNDEAMSIKGLDDGKPRFYNYVSSALGKSTSSDTLPYDYSKIKFGRIISQITDTTILCEIHWDSAFVDLKYYFKGTFKIVSYKDIIDSTISSIDTTISDTSWDYDTTCVPFDSTSKLFNHITHQKAIFLRDQNTNNADKDWKLKYVTPLIIQNNLDSLLNIKHVNITSVVNFPSISGADPLQTFFNRETLPSLIFNTTISVDVEVQNNSPFVYDPGELVLIHFGREINVDKKRVALSDIDNNGTHSGSFTVDSHGEKIYRLFIDLIDLETIFTSNGDYNSEIWIIPLRVP
ncbi:MAG: hypothetical protein ISS81_03760 [Candidatus Marinimicrobia bacterium]|nr:hypothetical protein [Candidatus Neomarinimicrobiota bacterium]